MKAETCGCKQSYHRAIRPGSHEEAQSSSTIEGLDIARNNINGTVPHVPARDQVSSWISRRPSRRISPAPVPPARLKGHRWREIAGVSTMAENGTDRRACLSIPNLMNQNQATVESRAEGTHLGKRGLDLGVQSPESRLWTLNSRAASRMRKQELPVRRGRVEDSR